MAALPIITFDRDDQNVERGKLHDCPAEFFTPAQMAFYLKERPGWSKCPQGYWVYIAYDALGRRLVVPGIRLTDDINGKKKFPDFGIEFSKSQIENFLLSHLEASELIKNERNSEFKNLTHDLRAMGAEIYSTALGARQQAEFKAQALIEPLDDVLAAQQMLSVRLDIVDYESGYAAGRPSQNIPIFKKVDKVLRCFRSKFRKHGIHYKIEGNSFAEIFGPPIFELIPVVIIENAIKYSPIKSELIVRFEETETEVIVRFESLGPKIKEQEKERIFDRNFRGQAAQGRLKGGSGIGLFGAKTLTEAHYDGKVYVNQVGNVNILQGVDFYTTRFTLVFPMANKDSRPKKRRIRRHD